MAFNMPRRNVDVVGELLREMSRIVRRYHLDVRRTGFSVDELIAGTAFFPGGTGIWRGEDPRGNLPEFFPECPVMFVAHNFDSVVAHDRAKAAGGEYRSSFFWKVFREYLESSAIKPEDCFFTNALMGLQPKSSMGSMPTVPGYEDECRKFLQRQFEIVKPRAVVALGRKARDRVHAAGSLVPWIDVLHPSAWEFRPQQTRKRRIDEQAAKIAQWLRAATGNPASRNAAGCV
jgi:hypothetical protein